MTTTLKVTLGAGKTLQAVLTRRPVRTSMSHLRPVESARRQERKRCRPGRFRQRDQQGRERPACSGSTSSTTAARRRRTRYKLKLTFLVPGPNLRPPPPKPGLFSRFSHRCFCSPLFGRSGGGTFAHGAKCWQKTVNEYLAELPADRREVIATLRELIVANLPAGYSEAMQRDDRLRRSAFAPSQHPQWAATRRPAALAAQKGIHVAETSDVSVYGDRRSCAWFVAEHERR